MPVASRYEDLRDLFERTITVRYIACFRLVTCRADDDAEHARHLMETSGYNMLPVLTDGTLLGYVERDSLRDGPCSESERRLGPPDLVADSTPILSLFQILQDRPRVFVLEANRVTGLVSRSDLQKAPVRMLLFALVTLLEMQLQRIVGILYPDAAWRRELSRTRLDVAERLRDERRERGEEIDLIDCLQFCDKRDLILGVSERIAHLGFPSRRQLEAFLDEVEELRDLLAHGQDLTAGSSWPGRIRLAAGLRAVLQQLEAMHEGSMAPLRSEAQG